LTLFLSHTIIGLSQALRGLLRTFINYHDGDMKMENYKCAVYIGRFQPYHLGHEEILKQALEISEKVLIITNDFIRANKQYFLHK